MRYRPNHPEIRERVVAELPQITDNLLAITEFTEEEVRPTEPRSQTRESALSPNMTSVGLERLGFTFIRAESLNGSDGTDHNSTMRSARLITMRGLLDVRDASPRQVESSRGDLSDALLLAVRGIIAHTPYPKAFNLRDHKPPSAPTIQEYIRAHSEPYLGLLAFMEGAQQRITNRALTKH